MEQQRIEELRRLYLFQLLNENEVAKIGVLLHEKTYEVGSKIFSEKEVGKTMYIMKAGSVKIGKLKDNVERELGLFGPGDFFGEIALFDDVLRTASATAVKTTIVLEIQREEFAKFIFENSAIAVKILYRIIQEMAKRLRRMNREEDAIFV